MSDENTAAKSTGTGILGVSDSPHIRSGFYIKDYMLNIILSLCPLLILGVYNYGMRVVSILAVSCLSACTFEFLWCNIVKKKSTLNDLSALCTGMLLTAVYNPSVPLWMPVIGSFFAITVFKKLMGGLGKSIINPIAATMLLLYAFFPAASCTAIEKKTYLPPLAASIDKADAVAGATPLLALKEGTVSEICSIGDMLLGNMSGAIGCISALLICACAAYMIIKHTVSFAVPCSMAASMTLLFLIFPAGSEAWSLAFRQLLTGSFLFTAFFVATDHATTPITLSGRIIYGCLCGMLTFMIRRYSGLTEGVFFAVCIADLTVPFLDKAGAFILRLHSLAAARIGNIFRKKGGIV